MSTHGVFVMKHGENRVIGFHLLHDGSNVIDFFLDVENETDPVVIFENTLNFFADSCYEDIPGLNLYLEDFNPDEDYAHINAYTLYFDGKKFYHNFDLDEEDYAYLRELRKKERHQ